MTVRLSKSNKIETVYDSKLLWHRLYFLTSCFYSNTFRGTDVSVIRYNEHSDMYRHKMYFLIIILHITNEYKIELWWLVTFNILGTPFLFCLFTSVSFLMNLTVLCVYTSSMRSFVFLTRCGSISFRNSTSTIIAIWFISRHLLNLSVKTANCAQGTYLFSFWGIAKGDSKNRRCNFEFCIYVNN